MKHIITFSLVALATLAFGQSRPEIHCKHFFYGYPYGAPSTNDLVIRDLYVLSNNDSTKFADWVAYKLTLHEVDGELDLDRNWRSEEWLADAETLEKSDYTSASSERDYDRGHQAPLGSFKNSVHASQTNHLSNITPQKENLNRGPWVKLENDIRTLVQLNRLAYVITGPLYEYEMEPLPKANEKHTVPSAYWKVVIVPTGSATFEHAAFIMDQESGRRDDVKSKAVTIDEVERRSGLDLLWELKDNVEATTEADKNLLWISTWVD